MLIREGKFTAVNASYDENGAYYIVLNRPKVKNAFNLAMYQDLTTALKQADAHSRCKLIVLTGNGDYYTSGNDLNNFFNPESAKRGNNPFKELVATLIDMKKPVIALVNGPAVGAGVTTLALCDMVIASDKATFHCPFTALALAPEGCSSYTFPMIMGTSMATEMLTFNKKATAKEMHAAGLVSQVIPHKHFHQITGKIIANYAQLKANPLQMSKGLLRTDEMRAKLHEVNERENEVIEKALTSDDAVQVVTDFFKAKSKL